MSQTKTTIFIAAVAALGLVAVGVTLWVQRSGTALPPGIASANGRVEANQVDIATKSAGRVLEIGPREGDMVEAGSVVATLDPAEIDAQLRQSEADAVRARKALASQEAVVGSRQGELDYAEGEMQRSAALVERGFATQQSVDQRRQLLTTADAALKAAKAQVEEAQASIVSADAGVSRLHTLVDDMTIRTPARGRIQYRLVEPGAILPAGGRIVTLLDLTDVNMTIFVPASVAGRLTVGDEARVVLDAAPGYVFDTTVSFVAAEAQFTPKAVETAAEREKLMFRVKLQAPAAMLRSIEDRVKSGLRGTGYVRTDPGKAWPATLAPRLPT